MKAEEVESEKPKVNLKQFERFAENPSSARHKIESLSIGTKAEPVQKAVVDSDGVVDEYEDRNWKLKVFDNKQFVKLFPDGQADLVKLTSAGIAVLTYIILNLKQTHDQITILPGVFGSWYITLEGCEKANTKMICYRGILDLLKREMIYLKTGEGSYFINVNKFFNGDRRKISWVADINDKLKQGIPVPKVAVRFDPTYKPKDK